MKTSQIRKDATGGGFIIQDAGTHDEQVLYCRCH